MLEVNRRVLDFDFEKVCCVTLATADVGVCLACGRFFHGRAPSTPAFLHALNEEHPLYMSLASGTAYRLPAGTEEPAGDLDDVRYAMFPTFDAATVRSLDAAPRAGVDLHGKPFTAGFLGLSSAPAASHMAAVIQVLCRIPPLRDLLLSADLRDLPDTPGSGVLKALGTVARKLWNPQPFRAAVSPHELLQAVRSASQDRFLPAAPGDAADFLAWLLNCLERALGAAGIPAAEALPVKGQLTSSTRRVVVDSERHMAEFYRSISDDTAVTKTVPYFFLALDLPPTPLFQEATGRAPLPQVELLDLLHKYDGAQVTSRGEYDSTYQLLSLPRYLVLHIRRLLRTEAGLEKNRTTVNFPLKGLQIGAVRYDLLASISHVGEARDGHYVAHVRHRATDSWFEMADQAVRPALPQTLFLTDTYIQVWELV